MTSGIDRARAEWIQLPWGRMRVYLAGMGPPVLALHGLAGSGRYWHGFAGALCGRFTVIAPDLAGFGASDKPDVDYDRAFHLNTVDALIEYLGLGWPRVVVGHSMGGVLGALWTARHPRRDHALALVSSPYPSYRPPRETRTGHGGRSIARRVVQTLWPAITLPYRSTVYPRAVIRDYARHTSASYWRSGYSLIWDRAIIDELALLRTVPRSALLLYARNDGVVPLTDRGHWHEALPYAQVQTQDTGGHQILLATHFAPLETWIDTLPSP